MGRGERQSICGVVVNEHPNLPRDAYDRLKAILHNCARHRHVHSARFGAAGV